MDIIQIIGLTSILILIAWKTYEFITRRLVDDQILKDDKNWETSRKYSGFLIEIQNPDKENRGGVIKGEVMAVMRTKIDGVDYLKFLISVPKFEGVMKFWEMYKRQAIISKFYPEKIIRFENQVYPESEKIKDRTIIIIPPDNYKDALKMGAITKKTIARELVIIDEESIDNSGDIYVIWDYLDGKIDDMPKTLAILLFDNNISNDITIKKNPVGWTFNDVERNFFIRKSNKGFVLSELIFEYSPIWEDVYDELEREQKLNVELKEINAIIQKVSRKKYRYF